MPAGDNYVAVDIPAVGLPVVPDLPSRAGRSWWMAALPAVGSLGAVGFLALAPRSPFIYVAGGLIVLVSIGMVAGNYVRSKRERRESRDEIRTRFLADLDLTRASFATRAARVQDAGSKAAIGERGLYVPIATDVVRAPVEQIEVGQRTDPFCQRRLAQLVQRHSVIERVSVQQALGPATTIAGSPSATGGVVRQILHGVVRDLDHDQVRIAVLTTKPHRWRALRWAPQHRHPRLVDAVGPARLVAGSVPALTALLEQIETPILLIVDHQMQIPAELEQRVQWIVVMQIDAEDPDLRIGDQNALWRKNAEHPVTAMLCSAADLEVTCRAAARKASLGTGALGTGALGTGVDGAVDQPLRPVLGSGLGGAVHLDVRETSRGGTGPHGMLIGVTGSGKSEVLRTIVAGLVSAQSPIELSLLLVDFKGGATFAPFERLPHTAAVITNLEEDPALVTRMHTALAAELRRRQRILKATGAASIEELPDGTSLPRLMVVVDEFSELLTAHPEMLEVLVQIGRVGRSLGVHLLIAAQRLDEGRLKGLDSHLTYRIALRTQSVAESRSVIGTGDAAALSNAPGHGYLRCGSAEPIPFRARYTGADVRARQHQRASAPALLHYPNGPLRPTSVRTTGPTILAAAIAAAAAMPGGRLPIWVPPPSRPATHDDMYDDLVSRPGRGYGTLTGTVMQAAIGVVDRPDLQRIETAMIDLATGHLAIVGTARSGTTTAAESAILSLALRNTPAELNLYLVEAAPGALGALHALPHVAAYAGGGSERTRAVVRRVVAIVDERERSAGAGQAPRIVLAIDGYARFNEAQDVLEPALLDIAQRGLAVGVHLLVTTHRWLDLRARLRELFGNRIELRLGDPVESEIDRRGAALVPRGRPGRGLAQSGHPLYGARAEVAELVARIDGEWGGPRARGLADLPAVLTIRNLSSDITDRGLCLAVERYIGHAVILPEETPFCFVIGDPGSGRTSVLRSLGLQDARRGAQLLVIDPRRRLLGDLPEDQVLGYAATPAAATDLLAGLVAGLERRMPPSEITARELRERSWWDGPPLHLLVDDHDIVTMVGTSLAVLRRFLPYAADLGLRVTIARRAAGAAAALHEETLSVLRDLGATALLLSRAHDEGSLLGVRPGPAAWGTGVLISPAGAALDALAITEQPRSAAAPNRQVGR